MCWPSDPRQDELAEFVSCPVTQQPYTRARQCTARAGSYVCVDCFEGAMSVNRVSIAGLDHCGEFRTPASVRLDYRHAPPCPANAEYHINTTQTAIPHNTQRIDAHSEYGCNLHVNTQTRTVGHKLASKNTFNHHSTPLIPSNLSTVHTELIHSPPFTSPTLGLLNPFSSHHH